MKTLMVGIVLLVTMQLNAGSLLKLNVGGNDKPVPAENSWVKSENGIWLGNYHMWYKMDRKNNTVKFSRNKKKWKVTTDVAWQDNQGRWLYIDQNKLVWSMDGKKWEELTSRIWQDVDGNWYRFDADWELYVAK